MMDKKVTEEQITRLYSFTRQHFVEYYDLQTELVDHLANAIETVWHEHPNLDFETALQQEFKKFGIFGFMDVVELRQLALRKKYNKLIWSYFKEFFRLPKIILTIVSIAVTFQLLLIEPLLYQALLLTVLVFSGTRLFMSVRKYRRKVKQTGRKWLFEEQIFTCGGTGMYLYVAVQALRLGGDNPSPYYILALSILLVLLVLFDYIILFIIPAKAEEHLKAAYPEYNLEITQ